MKKIILNTIIFLLCILIFEQCAFLNAILYAEYTGNEHVERDECLKWKDSPVLVVLYNEPAVIMRGCHSESDLFYIKLLNKPFESKWIFPCNGVPEEFQIDGLSVLVCGNILEAGKWNPCFPSAPNIRQAPHNIFQLKEIKKAKK